MYRREQFFKVDDIPSEAKVKLAALHLEGKALQWHQIFMQTHLTRELPNWEEYVRALSDGFGVFLYDDPMVELMNLKQIVRVFGYASNSVKCQNIPFAFSKNAWVVICFLFPHIELAASTEVGGQCPLKSFKFYVTALSLKPPNLPNYPTFKFNRPIHKVKEGHQIKQSQNAAVQLRCWPQQKKPSQLPNAVVSTTEEEISSVQAPFDPTVINGPSSTRSDINKQQNN
ncbi:hypothetical protein BUALT_BualtUnG0022100 [Buddleja alternifolia]|uniref:Retrotransposon gag domain-containing protein n=1 Tax=Buddleja alternifolia TaxID=168488 RepID=A0AAV6W7M3_9LAMI|nr:hypothetical protein BUALT_BualtUnG0022100 [Buddleja alternifolia]